MTVKVFSSLPVAARKIREQVFIKEQGFIVEFDDKDDIAVHLVVFDDSDTPIATCRIFQDRSQSIYVIGRVAVVKEYRGKRIGLMLLNEAEKYIKENGGECIVLHAQQRSTAFYNKAGYTEFGDVEYDEGCPHVCMKKALID